MWATLGAALSLLGALALYLASPHQRLLARPWPRSARAGAAGCLALALPAWSQAQPRESRCFFGCATRTARPRCPRCAQRTLDQARAEPASGHFIRSS